MDFKIVLEKLLTAFKEQNIHYALMGGIYPVGIDLTYEGIATAYLC